MKQAVLYINRSNSRCGACNGNADPHEDAHDMKSMVGEGCGAVFIAVSSDYMGTKERVIEMRPDLEWRDWVAWQ